MCEIGKFILSESEMCCMCLLVYACMHLCTPVCVCVCGGGGGRDVRMYASVSVLQ